MKGLQGILIAVALGIVAAVCNWFYITGHAKDFVKVSFVVVKSGTQIDVGDRFKKSHFEKVDIPENNLGHLETVAVRWSDLDTVVGQTSPRSFSGSEILLRYDLKTPPQRDVSELLGENEVLRWVPVDQRSFTPDHVNPGNLVRFVVPMFTAAKGARGNAPPKGSAAVPQSLRQSEEFGPFEVLTLGNRRGRKEILRSRGATTGQENLIGIRVASDGPSGKEAQRLFDALRLTGNSGVQIILLSAKTPPADATPADSSRNPD